ncbi:Alpha/Beta hydrolase fold [Phytophthora cactorum]|nr:Alpha/Beta hydrolase fold [Phytophthora cactorum]
MPEEPSSPRRPGPPALLRSSGFRLALLVLSPFFALLLTLWGIVGRALTLPPKLVAAASFVVTWALYLCIPHIPVRLLDWPLVITLGLAILSQLPRHNSHVAHGVVPASLVAYAIIRVSLTSLESGTTEKSIVETLAVFCCLFPVWLSICNLHLWLPSDLDELEKVERKIYEHFIVTEFSQTKVAGLGTIHVPYCGDGKQLPPRNLVLVHGYLAGNAFWTANLQTLAKSFNVYAVEWKGIGRSDRPKWHPKTDEEMDDFFVESLEDWRRELNLIASFFVATQWGTYFAEKYPQRVEHLIISPAGVNSSSLKQEDLPSFLKFTALFYITPMASGDIAFYTHLHPGASARRRALDSILTPEKLHVPLTILYGGGMDWMNSEYGEAVVRRLENTQYAVFRLVPMSGHQVFMDNPSDFNQMLIQATHDTQDPVAMANRSEDEWSLVSDNEEVLSYMSFDEVDPEPEAQVESDLQVTVSKTEVSATTSNQVEVPTPEEEIADVLSLLADTRWERSAAAYSREIRVSLLSPAHQDWFVGSSRYSSHPSTIETPKRNIKLAFIGSDVRPKSFPERLRTTTAAMRPLLQEVVPPKYTEVTPFEKDQATQVDFDAPPVKSHETRATLLRNALDRSMTMANQLRAKCQDNERLSLRVVELESVVIQIEQKNRRHAIMIKMNERSLTLAKQQAKLTAEYQDNLKMIADNLRLENAQLTAQNAVMRGEDKALAVRSLAELEELEAMLTRGMESVRAALRAKYRAAIEKHHEKDLCVVCFEKPVSVVLLPCRHQVLCASCAVRVTTCPIDRKDIEDKVLTYGLNAYTNSSS